MDRRLVQQLSLCRRRRRSADLQGCALGRLGEVGIREPEAAANAGRHPGSVGQRLCGLAGQRSTIDEGQSATFTAQAGGGKVYWILKRDGGEHGRGRPLPFTLDAGRVVADTPCILQFKAVYPDEVKILDIPVTIRIRFPNRTFRSSAGGMERPRHHRGRARDRQSGSHEGRRRGQLALPLDRFRRRGDQAHRPRPAVLNGRRYSGPITVTADIDNGGQLVAVDRDRRYRAQDGSLGRADPEKDEKPEDNQFYARDDKNEGTLYYNGTLDQPADAVFLRVYADDKPFKTETHNSRPTRPMPLR